MLKFLCMGKVFFFLSLFFVYLVAQKLEGENMGRKCLDPNDNLLF